MVLAGAYFTHDEPAGMNLYKANTKILFDIRACSKTRLVLDKLLEKPVKSD
jgi:hypothetical protein